MTHTSAASITLALCLLLLPSASRAEQPSSFAPTPVDTVPPPPPPPPSAPTVTSPAPAAAVAFPPSQPPAGPGGAEYRHSGITSAHFGEGAKGYWIFEPADPKPAQAPLIIFNHGWSALQPQIYGSWIEHLVKRGNIVIFPLYQDSLWTPVTDFTPNALAGVIDAIHRLQTEEGHVYPQLDKLALAGHSMGGIVTANLAALWEMAGLPQPRALMCVEPGNTWASKQIAIHLEDLSRIPQDALLICVAGDRDYVTRDLDARRIFHEATALPATNKSYVTLVSDDHGQPPLQATHFAPLAFMDRAPGAPVLPSAGPLRERGREALAQRRRADGKSTEPGSLNTLLHRADALNYFGTWKLFDGLTDAAFYGRNREYALGNTPEERFMGRWSDGVPVKELIVAEQP